jgi:4-hydroxybenzoate polyprenyltransferase
MARRVPPPGHLGRSSPGIVLSVAVNRVLDAGIDARNAGTRVRCLPAGLLAQAFAWGFIVF